MEFFKNKIVQIVIACLIPFIGGLITSSFFMGGKEPWYSGITKPSWNPPDWIFAPVWTVLYLSMGYASFRVYDEGDGFSGIAKIPLIMYIIHLIVNLTWSPVFFHFHLIGGATIHIVVLWVLILLTGLLFYRVEKFAGILLLPYFAWATFASFLCFTIWRLNS